MHRLTYSDCILFEKVSDLKCKIGLCNRDLWTPVKQSQNFIIKPANPQLLKIFVRKVDSKVCWIAETKRENEILQNVFMR